MSGMLQGVRVVNTRAVHQAAELDSALIAAGAVPISFPCIEIVPPRDTSTFEGTLSQLLAGEFEWLVLTSANAVSALAGRLPVQQITAKVAAIGHSTSVAIERDLGLSVSVAPERASVSELAAAIPVEPGDRVLLPVSEIARIDLEQALAARGAVVTRVAAYRTVTGRGGADLRRLVATGRVDALVFASPSAIQGLLARFSSDGGCPWDRFAMPVVCIGETTRKSAIELGFTSVVAAANQSIEGIIGALESICSARVQGEPKWR